MAFPNPRLGTVAVISLVALRVIVGWHFYMEGASKVREGGFASTGFLNAATGPLADQFHSLIPDYDGSIRLDSARMKSEYEGLLKRAVETFDLNEEQAAAAEKIVKSSQSQLADVYDQWKGQIAQHEQETARIKRMDNDPIRQKVESLRKQRIDIETKWKALVKPVLSSVDRITADLETELNELGGNIQAAAEETRKANGSKQKVAPKSVKLRFPTSVPIDVGLVDKIIPIFDMTIGILLICGLLTPIAGVAAGLFLGSIVLTQFPGWPGSQPTYYQAIEMVACFALAATDSGRYAGLDFLPWAFWHRNDGKPRVE